jgi:uncharacterized heparinase superfamily protein
MRGFGSHSHNDLLSFEYWSNEQAWLIDPGSYIYSPDPAARNAFRSTKAHNTVRVDGAEINPFSEARIFQIVDYARTTLHCWESDSELDQLDVEHSGYQRLDGGVSHRRCFKLDKRSGRLTIADSFAGSGEHAFEWFFHAGPGVELRLTEQGFLLERAMQRVAITFSDEPLAFECMNGEWSPSYGVRASAMVGVARCTREANFQLTFVIGGVGRKGA